MDPFVANADIEVAEALYYKVPFSDRLPCKHPFCVTCLQPEWKCRATTHMEMQAYLFGQAAARNRTIATIAG